MSGTTFDVIIIGAGSVGAPASFFMAEAGLKTLVLDRFASVGQGSNKAAIGGVRATHSDPAKIQLGLDSIEVFSTWAERYGENIEWVAGGYCFVAYREQERRILQDLLVVQKRYGLDIDWLDRQELLTVVPALNPEGLMGGTFSAGDGSASPMRCALAFYRGAVARGAVYHFRERVTEILVRSGSVQGVKTDQGTYYGDVVVNAAGPWARPVAQMAGLDVPVVSEAHEAGITEPVASFLRPMVVDIRPTHDSTNYYFYQHATGQVIFCITPSPPIYGTDRRETSVFLPQVARRMVDLVPRLRHLKVRRSWRGLYPMTPDGLPVVGTAPELKGYVHAVGMCGQGYMLGPGLGHLLVRLVQGTLREIDEEVLRGLRPDRAFEGQEELK
jgi:sarcosine oxidase subunit beta